MNEEIKSCPFCGSTSIDICRTNHRACWLECQECGAANQSSPRRTVAIENWNRRPDPIPAAIGHDGDAEYTGYKRP